MTLDLKVPAQRAQFKVCVVVPFVTMWYARAWVWGVESYSALTHFWEVGDTSFFYAALPLCEPHSRTPPASTARPHASLPAEPRLDLPPLVPRAGAY